jgi:hypothetical protein
LLLHVRDEALVLSKPVGGLWWLFDVVTVRVVDRAVEIPRVWASALDDAGLACQRRYDCRHSFASLLFHEGRSVVYVARQLGHSTAVCMRTYAHVIEELEDAPRISAEDAILAARHGADVRTSSDGPTELGKASAPGRLKPHRTLVAADA